MTLDEVTLGPELGFVVRVPEPKTVGFWVGLGVGTGLGRGSLGKSAALKMTISLA